MINANGDMEQRSKSPEAQNKVAQDFDRFRDTYTQQISDAVSFSRLERGFFISVKSECLMRLARAHFGDLGRIAALDLGCGIGEYHEGLANVFGSLSAIDVSEQSVDYARARNPTVRYQSYAGGRLPYDSESFDLVFAICVIHHVPPALWDGFAAEMYRVVRPGGLAVVLEHNPLNPATQYIVRTCPIDEEATLLSKSRTARLLRRARFVVRQSRTILSVPPVNGVTRFLDRVLGHLPFGAQYYVTGEK